MRPQFVIAGWLKDDGAVVLLGSAHLRDLDVGTEYDDLASTLTPLPAGFEARLEPPARHDFTVSATAAHVAMTSGPDFESAAGRLAAAMRDLLDQPYPNAPPADLPFPALTLPEDTPT